MRTILCAVLAMTFVDAQPLRAQSRELGIFTDQSDVGSVGHPGSLKFDPAKGEYLIAGSGENMWEATDAFHFVWKKMSGDLALAANIRWDGTDGHEHRKACLMIRQTLEPDSPYVDAALHGNGLASLQYRETAGGPTREIQSSLFGAARLRLEKRGSYASMSVALAGQALEPAGGSFRIEFKEPFYVGLAVCAHDNRVLEKARFSEVELTALPGVTSAPPRFASTLEVADISALSRRAVYYTSDRIEAPNWSRDGRYFIFNSNGRLYKLPAVGGQPQLLDTGSAIHCNNDHGISPDGTLLALSDQGEDNQSRVYVLPITGGVPRLVTPRGPSYWHGWSPDGKTLVYCAQRNGEYDIYSIPVEGGEETRLTTAPGLDDGPEYSPDGRYIYFNSERTGLMQIWRMKPDGSGQEQVTSDEYNNWFPHPSPDGRWIAFLSYAKEVKGHPQNKDVLLRLMPSRGGQIQVLAKLFGGQGTINVPSWAPDSRQLAFVSYQMAYP